MALGYGLAFTPATGVQIPLGTPTLSFKINNLVSEKGLVFGGQAVVRRN
jgi:hypothetical protein